MRRVLKKMVCAVLCFALIVATMPIVITAESNTDLSEFKTVQISDQNSSETPYILSEVEEKRELDKKVFLMSDGTYMSAVYGQPVHYEKDGNWENIDNSFTDTIDDNDESVAENKKNAFKIKFAKKSKNKKLVSLKKEGYKIDWALSGAKKVEAEFSAEDNNENKKTASLKNITGTVNYENILAETDLRYTVTGNTVKEDIILKSKNAPKSFVFSYELKKLEYSIQDNGDILFYDPDIPETEVFVLEKPYMYDAAGSYSNEITVLLTETKKGFQIEIIPDSEWLSEKEREWPVTIDPTVTYPQNAISVTDTYIHSGDPTNHSQYSYLLVGKGTGGESEAYIKFDSLLPMSYNTQVLSAKLYLQTVEISGLMAYTYTNPVPQITVQQVGGSWSDTMVWSGRPSDSLSGVVTDCVDITGNNKIFTWDITKIVNSWYNGAANYGVVLRAHESVRTAGRGATFISPEYISDAYVSGTDVHPYLAFQYRVANGLESYWSYHTATANNAGTIYVNDFNGNLVYQTPALASTTGNRLPFDVSLIYNSAYSHVVPGTGVPTQIYGRGYRLNMQQYLSVYSDEDVPYSLLDGDGTLHYFYKYTTGTGAIEYRDQDGLGLKVSNHANYTSDARYDVTDKDGNIRVFDSNGYIRSVSDPNGNTLVYTYDSSNRITKITDAAGKSVNLSYGSNGMLSSITDPWGRITQITYNSYDSISQIRFQDNTYIDISYSYSSLEANNCMLYRVYEKSSSSLGRYYIQVAYDSLTTATVYRTPKVLSVAECNTSSADIGNSFTYNYELYQTTVTGDNGISETVQFNSAGNPIYITDNEGNTQSQNFTNQIGFANNRVTTAKTQRNVSNLIKNHRLQYDMSDFYTVYATGQTFTAVWDSTKGYTATGSIKVTRTNVIDTTNPYAYVAQDFVAEKDGYYTFSAYVNTNAVQLAGSAGIVRIERWSASGNHGGYQASVNYTQTDEWKRVSVTMHYYAGETVRCLVGTNGAVFSGTVWFDDLQLEYGETANSYNLVENGSFTNGIERWFTRGTVNYTDISSDTPGEYKKAVTIIGEPAKASLIGQVIKVHGKKGDVFCFSAWGKAVAAESGDFQIVLEFYDAGGVYYSSVFCGFNELVTDWQYASKKIIAPCDYTKVNVYYFYYYNVNTLYGTGMSLLREEYGQTYVYDDDGNVISSTEASESTSSFDYTNNQLSKIFNPSGSNYAYTYNTTTNQVRYALSSDGILEDFNYDTYGNPTEAVTWSMKPATEIQSGKTYAIINAKTHNAMDCAGTAIRAQVHNWQFNKNYSYQKWTAEATPDGYMNFNVQPVENGTVFRLDVPNGANTDELQMIIHNQNTSNAQKFRVQSNSDGTFTLLTASSNFTKCIDGQPSSTEDSSNGVKIKQCTYVEGDLGQKWYFYEMDITEDNNEFIKSSAEYSANGTQLTSVTDANGNETAYTYKANGLLESVTDSEDNVTTYTYYDNDQLKSVTSGGVTNTYSYEKDRLTSITTSGGTTYEFEYDLFGRRTDTLADEINLSSIEYTNTGLVSVMHYGNQNYISYTYDSLERLTEKIYNDDSNKKVMYYYGANGQISIVLDTIENTSTRYVYDLSGRPAEVRVYNGASVTSTTLKRSVKYNYEDKTNYITSVTYTSPLGTQTVNYGYGSLATETMPDTVYTVSQNGTEQIKYSFDDLARLSSRTISSINKTQTYTYKQGGHGTNSTTTQIASVTEDGVTTSYSYDMLGNITAIYKNGVLYESYEYDSLSQLTKVTCENGDIYEYFYDASGNITSVKLNGTVVKSYGYTADYWSDRLTSFNGESITFDTIGNPLTYRNGMNFAWQNGRQLSGITKGTDSISYGYNADGTRISKTVNGVTTNYTYIDGRLIGEKTGNNTIIYLYDENGSKYGFTYNGVSYYYNLNLQGDVIGIYDASGNTVAEYSYNVWGELLGITGSLADTIGQINPIRYRGYYYDAETGLYYVSSRYYDPEIGRWINADNMITTASDLTGLNLFAYCGNNPVNRVDPSGQFWISAIIKAVVVVVAVVAVVAKVVCTVKETKRVQKELDSLPEPTADITESFRETLKTNANTVKETTQNEGIIESGKQFYNKVRNKGEWDLKQLPEYQGTFQFNDLVIQGQDIGNINFGYTGKALGLPDSVLLAGAGFAQIKAGTSNFSFIMASNGDDLRDQMYIMYGIMLYNEDH